MYLDLPYSIHMYVCFCVCDTSLLAASTPTGLSAVSLRHTRHTHTNPSCETYLLFAFIVHTANCDLPSSAQLLYVQILTYVVCVCVCVRVWGCTLSCVKTLSPGLFAVGSCSLPPCPSTLSTPSLSPPWSESVLGTWGGTGASSVREFDQQTWVLSESSISKQEFCLRVRSANSMYKVCVLSMFNFCVCLPCVVTCLFPCLVLVLPCSRHVLFYVCLSMPCALLLLFVSPPLTCSQSPGLCVSLVSPVSC